MVAIEKYAIGPNLHIAIASGKTRLALLLSNFNSSVNELIDAGKHAKLLCVVNARSKGPLILERASFMSVLER